MNHTYGYGVCVEDIEVEKNRLLALIQMAPKFYEGYQEWEEE